MLMHSQCTCKPSACSSRVISRFGSPLQRANMVAKLDRGCNSGFHRKSHVSGFGKLRASSEGEPVMMPNNLQETAMLDKLVDLLLECKSQEEVCCGIVMLSFC